MKLWPWQEPGHPGWFALGDAYELAYASPARKREHATDEYHGYLSYLFTAKVRTLTADT